MTPPASTTGTTGTTRHPDVSEISDLAEGLLSPSRTVEVRRHLGECTLCADVRTSLDEIRALLGTLPGPARMPADIAGRIDAALAAEALLDATTPRAGDPHGTGKGTRPAPEPRHLTAEPDVSRETSPAAPSGPGAHRPSGHPTGPSGPGRRRARRRIAVFAGLATATTCALGIFLFGQLSTPPAQDTAARTGTSSSSEAAAPEGTFTAQGLQDSVRDLLVPETGPKAVPGEKSSTYGEENAPSAPGVASGDQLAGTPVPACVQKATGRPETPLATQAGTYEGIPAHLLVLPHPGDSARVDAYLVDAACETGGSATGKVLLTRTYPRS